MRYTSTFFCLSAVLLFSCSSGKELTPGYYKQNEPRLISIKDRFKKIHRSNPFSLEVKDKDFSTIGLEIITDTIRYVYSFDLAEHHLTDTLRTYRFNVPEMTALINDMKQMHCTWITNLDYYENRQEKFMVFLSLRDKETGTNRREKYFTLVFFDQRQYFDNKGRLLDKEKSRNIKQINGQTFYKINDRVCFTLSGSFR